MKIIPSWRIQLVLLFTAAALVRLAFVWMQNPSQLMWPDEIAYDNIAWNLAQTGHYEAAAYDSAPALPVFLASIYKLCGHSFRAARIAQALLGAFMAVVAGWIGAALFDKRAGFCAGLGVAFYPQWIYLSGVFYAEHLFACLIMLSVWCLVQWSGAGRRTWLLASGVSLAVSVLCRSVGFAFFPIALGYVWWAGRRRTSDTALLAVIMAAVILPWTARNYVVFHHFVPVSTGSGMHLWRGNNELSRGDANDRHLMPFSALWKEYLAALPSATEREALRVHNETFVASLQGHDEVERDQLYAAEGRAWLSQHPARAVKLTAQRLVTLYAAFSKTLSENETVSVRNQIVAAGSFYPVLLLGLMSLLWARRWRRATWIVLGMIVSLTLAYLPMTACTRFRMPMDGLWILLASFTVIQFWDLARTRHRILP